ncbi:hypothetical protein IAR55_004071 [Kwoniella newhampshirensis]|uniref:DNA polymerase lambda n=1 Tax=Kwoniella newhampshirensis TaxID=1651941 RepID=A0AAW0YYS6_9TREE
MLPARPSRRRDFWSELDRLEASGELDETVEEAATFAREVMEEVKWKEEAHETAVLELDSNMQGDIPNGENNQEGPADPLSSVPGGAFDDIPLQEPSNIPLSPSHPAEDVFVPPSFRPSQFLRMSTPKPLTSPIPSVPTPLDTSFPRLLPPKSGPIPSHVSPLRTRRSAIHDTPECVASPIDTPTTSAPQPSRPHLSTILGEGQGRRDDPDTPVPIGKALGMKSKKDLLAVTKHFEVFAKGLNSKDDVGKGVGRKGKGRSTRSKMPNSFLGGTAGVTGLGGKVFDELRFCIPPEVNQVAKHKQRWEIISKLGGQVTLQPDTAITHVIYDAGKSASLLAQRLGLDSLSELPEGTICVKWDWVVQCKLAGSLLDPSPWLSFPKTSFTRAVSANAIRPTSRMFDITDQLRGKSVSISRKREPTASDSDTEESSKKKARAADTRSMTIFPPVPEREAEIEQPVADPPRAVIMQDLPKGVATRHVVADGPGWGKAANGQRDALDVMIEGVIDGSLSDPEVGDGDDEEGDKQADHLTLKPYENPNPKADRCKCGQKSDVKGYKRPNEWLAQKFERLHEMYAGQVGKNAFAIRGYQRAASIMRRIEYPITTGAQARAIPGIGPGLAERIDEFLTGAPGRAYFEDTEQARCVALFKDIYGVGRQVANDLYRLGARSITDLRTGQYPLTPGQQVGLSLYEDLKSRIPRDECKALYEMIKAEAMAFDNGLWVEIMGSYRRGQEDSGDVDILITREWKAGEKGKDRKGALGELVGRLRRKGIITHDLGAPSDWNAPEAKWMGVGKVSPSSKYRRIDILCIPHEQWGAALIYLTGECNEVFNRSLRLYARKLGYSLNQRGLYKGVLRGRDGLKTTEGEVVASKTEQEIFDVLGLRWRHPHHRRP